MIPSPAAGLGRGAGELHSLIELPTLAACKWEVEWSTKSEQLELTKEAKGKQSYLKSRSNERERVGRLANRLDLFSSVNHSLSSVK